MWARQCHGMWVSVIGCLDVGQCHRMLGCGPDNVMGCGSVS